MGTDPKAGTTTRNGVDKVITLVATSTESWEAAARAGVAEATKSIRALALARVIERDVQVTDGEVTRYRIKLEMAFQVDRLRPGLDPQAAPVEVRRYLIVANQTLGTGELVAEVDRLISEGPAEFHLLVPASHSKTYARARRLSMLGADPVTGLPTEQMPVAEEWLGPDVEGLDAAQKRLDAQLARMKNASYDVSGEIGDPDPIRAISQVMSRSSFDEIILSTLPAGLSRWLKADLPSRVARATGVPVKHVPGKPPSSDF
ncbi:MAG: flavin-binding protein dodecin [Acidimicrobiales bacterium]|jgi:flavin-binding protein dodecin